MGIAYTEEDLYAHVLAMEQIMSTGGGWQDQVGGITPGLKYITSMPGLQQQLQVAHIELSPQTKLTVSRTEKILSIRKEFASTCSAFL